MSRLPSLTVGRLSVVLLFVALAARGLGSSSPCLAAATLLAVESAAGRCDAAPADGANGAIQRGTIRGRVFDEALKPLAHATVSAQRVRFTNGEPRPGATGSTAVTNADGEYRFDALPRGQYYICAIVTTASRTETTTTAATPKRMPRAAARPEKLGFGPTFYPGATALTQAMRVHVRAGQDVAGIDIPLQKRPLARVSGRLLSARETLHDGAYVSLVASPTTGPGRAEGFLGTSRLTADRRFTFDDVPPGEYVVQARSIPLSTVNEIVKTGSSAPLTANPDSEFGSLVVTVDGADLDDLTVMMSQGGRLRGKVMLDGQPFKPIKGYVAILAEPTEPDTLVAGATEAEVGLDGTFEIRGIAGQFVLRIGGIGDRLTLSRITAMGGDITDTGVIVRPGDVSNIEVMLSSAGTELTGQVVVDTTSTSHQCLVIVFSDDAKRWSWIATRYLATVRASAGGAFSIAGLPPGTYLAVAVSDAEEDQWRDPDYLKSISHRASAIRLQEGERRTLVLRVE